MSLLLLKSRIKKVGSWLKHHWYVPLLILALIVAVLIWTVTRNGAYIATLLDVLENSRESYRKEVEKLNEIRRREDEEKRRVLSEYNKNIEKLEKEYVGNNEELNAAKKKEIKKLVEEGYNDPERLSRELARLYGLEHG